MTRSATSDPTPDLEPSGPGPTRRRTFGRVGRERLFPLLALLVGLVPLLLVEGLLRISPWRAPSREEWNRKYNLVSIEQYYRKHDAWFAPAGEEGGVQVCGPVESMVRARKHRANGMQWDRFPCEKAPGTFRIVTLGASTVQGFEVDAAETFSTRLEELLQGRTSRPVEVINAAVAGYTTVQIRAQVPHLLALEPDLFVLYEGHNDYNYFLVADAAELTPRWIRTLRDQGDRLQTWRTLRWAWVRLHPPEGAARSPFGWGRPGGARQRPPQVRDQPRSVPPTREGRREVIRQETEARRLLEARFTESVESIASHGVDLVLLSPVSRLWDPPVDSIHWKDLADSDLSRWNATSSIDEALAIDDTWSHLQWRAGERDRMAGRLDTARLHYMASLDWNPPTCLDRAPHRHARVVQAAAGKVGAGYLDLWPVFEEAAATPGLPADDLFLDTIHLRPEGHLLVARTLADWLLREGWVEGT